MAYVWIEPNTISSEQLMFKCIEAQVEQYAQMAVEAHRRGYYDLCSEVIDWAEERNRDAQLFSSRFSQTEATQ